MPNSQNNEDYLNKEVFEVHLKYVHNSLDGIRDMSVKIMDRLDKQEKIMYRNTLTVEEHHKRSNHLEQRQEEFLTAVRSIKTDIEQVVLKVEQLDSELLPMKALTASNTKVISQITWINDNKYVILKTFVVSGVISIILYLVLKDIEAVRAILKLVF